MRFGRVQLTIVKPEPKSEYEAPVKGWGFAGAEDDEIPEIEFDRLRFWAGNIVVEDN